MKQIRISDVTMKQSAGGFALSFREKIELAKLLDTLGVSGVLMWVGILAVAFAAVGYLFVGLDRIGKKK